MYLVIYVHPINFILNMVLKMLQSSSCYLPYFDTQYLTSINRFRSHIAFVQLLYSMPGGVVAFDVALNVYLFLPITILALNVIDTSPTLSIFFSLT